MNKAIGVLAACAVLAGCGGGGGGDGGSTAPTAQPLAAYAGTWKQGCTNHEIETATLVLDPAGALAVSFQDTYYANTDCTGAVVATGTYGKAVISIRHVAAASGVAVKMLNGQVVNTNVDRTNATSTAASKTFTGTGVTTRTVNGKLVWRITFAGGSVETEGAIAEGSAAGAMTILNGELLLMTPVAGSTTSFEVDTRYVR